MHHPVPLPRPRLIFITPCKLSTTRGGLSLLKEMPTERVPFIFIAVSKDKTCPLVGVYQLDDEAQRQGRREWQRAADRYKTCAASNHWPGLSDQIETLSLPSWAIQSGSISAAEIAPGLVPPGFSD